LDRTCERYDQTVSQIRTVPMLGESTQMLEQSYRWIEPIDGEPFVVSRVLSPTPIDFSSALVAVDQQYSFVVLQPQEGATRRVEAFWVDARIIGLQLPEYFAVDMAASEMVDQAALVDAILDSE
jgi:hypothetical protein